MKPQSKQNSFMFHIYLLHRVWKLFYTKSSMHLCFDDCQSHDTRCGIFHCGFILPFKIFQILDSQVRDDDDQPLFSELHMTCHRMAFYAQISLVFWFCWHMPILFPLELGEMAGAQPAHPSVNNSATSHIISTAKFISLSVIILAWV